MTFEISGPQDMADWEPLHLEWHGNYAFLDGALLVDEGARTLYVVLDPASGSPEMTAQRARDGNYPAAPLAAQKPVWRHRAHPALLRDAQRDYCLLSGYHEEHRYYPVKSLQFRFGTGLQEVGRGYWRDDARVYFSSDDGIETVDEPVPESLCLFNAEAGSAFTASNLAHGSNGFFRNGDRIAAADAAVQETNHQHYLIIDGQVCWLRYGDPLPLYKKDGSLLPIADPGGFYMLSGRWGTDGHSVIVQAQSGSSVVRIYFYSIDDADLPSFTVLNERYAVDAKRAYYVTGKSIPYKGSFSVLRKWMPDFDEMGRVIGGHERESRKIAVDDEYVYGAGIKIRGAHGPTFRHLGFSYYRDRAHVYHRNKRLEADADSFVVAFLDREDSLRGILAGDKHGPVGSNGIVGAADLAQWAPFFEARPDLHGYWWHRLKAQDPSATKPVEALRDIGQGFALGDRVYFEGSPIEGLDPLSFQLLSRNLCGDCHGLYLTAFGLHRQIPERFSDAPVERFRPLDPDLTYLSDGSAVFCHVFGYSAPTPVPKADLLTFESAGYGWAKDKRGVYYCGQLKKGLDPQRTTFAGHYAFGDGAMFVDGKRLDVEFTAEEVSVPHPAFLMLGARKLFFGRRPISANRIDLATLQFLDRGFARDRRRWYMPDPQFGLKEASEADYLASQAAGSIQADGAGLEQAD